MISRNALLINGDEHSRDLYQTILEFNGYGVRQARTGLEAMTLLEHSIPDVIVQELDLGSVSGLTLIRTLRRKYQTQGIPILVVSANALDQDRVDARDAGCTSFLAKPCTPTEMMREVERMLANDDGAAGDGDVGTARQSVDRDG
jgi:CheY-like chemotaxis protein